MSCKIRAAGWSWKFLCKSTLLFVTSSALFLSNFAQAELPIVSTFINPGSGTWTCPGGVNLVQVEVWGGGGGGAGFKNIKMPVAGVVAEVPMPGLMPSVPLPITAMPTLLV